MQSRGRSPTPDLETPTPCFGWALTQRPSPHPLPRRHQSRRARLLQSAVSPTEMVTACAQTAASALATAAEAETAPPREAMVPLGAVTSFMIARTANATRAEVGYRSCAQTAFRAAVGLAERWQVLGCRSRAVDGVRSVFKIYNIQNI